MAVQFNAGTTGASTMNCSPLCSRSRVRFLCGPPNFHSARQAAVENPKREDVTTVRFNAFPLNATPSGTKQPLKPLPLLQRRLGPEIRSTR